MFFFVLLFFFFFWGGGGGGVVGSGLTVLQGRMQHPRMAWAVP